MLIRPAGMCVRGEGLSGVLGTVDNNLPMGSQVLEKHLDGISCKFIFIDLDT